MNHQAKYFDGNSSETIVTGDMEDRARAIDREWRTRRAAILADRNLSNEGKRVQLEDIDARRVSAVSALQEEATRYIGARTKVLGEKLQRAAADELEARRKLLGDAVIVDLWARRLPKMTGRAMLDAYSGAVGWEREVIRAYALAALDDRRTEAGDLVKPADVLAAQGLQPEGSTELDELREKVRNLTNGATWVESLDMDGQRRQMAVTFGVSYEAALQAEDLQPA